MTNMNTKSALLSFILLCLSSFEVSAWTIEEKCEGNVGEQIPAWFSLSNYSNDTVFRGNSSCQIGIAKDSDGWAEWGSVLEFPETLKKGDELWLKVNIFFPDEFDYSAQPHLKFLRLHTRASPTESHGYVDFYLTPDGKTHWDNEAKIQSDAPFYFYYESKPITKMLGDFAVDRVQKGKWESYEIYYRLDSVSESEGGVGRVRIWKNNKLLADLDDQITLKDSGDEANAFYLFTYWNGKAPKSQHLYVDDITITSETPLNKDEFGFPYIGRPDAPKAPSSFNAN